MLYKWDQTKTDFIPQQKNFIDITGLRYGRLVAIYPFRLGKVIKWVLRCDCGSETTATVGTLRCGNTTSCGCFRAEVTSARNKIAFSKGCGKLTGSHISDIRIGARSRNIDFNVSKEYLWNLFLSQNGKCALSGQDIHLGQRYQKDDRTASLDRINSSLGYLENNVQWTHKEINKMKWDKSDEEFIRLCKLVVENINEC